MVTTHLPGKLSALIRVALADLKLCEKDDHYEIWMSDWHSPSTRTGKCEVCLAGSVMAQTLGTPRSKYTAPSYFSNSHSTYVQNKLYALNCLRTGEVATACQFVGIKNYIDFYSLDRTIVMYRRGEETFHKEMNILADDMELAGL